MAKTLDMVPCEHKRCNQKRTLQNTILFARREDLIVTCLLVVVHVMCCLRRNTKVSAISAAPSLTQRMLCSSTLFEREMWGGRRTEKGQGKRRVIGWLGGTCVKGCLKCPGKQGMCSFAPANFFLPPFSCSQGQLKKSKGEKKGTKFLGFSITSNKTLYWCSPLGGDRRCKQTKYMQGLIGWLSSFA